MAKIESKIAEVGTRREDGATLKLVTSPEGIESLEFSVHHTSHDADALFGHVDVGAKLQKHVLADYNPTSLLLRTFPAVTSLGSAYLLQPKYKFAMLAVEGQASLTDQLVRVDPARLELLPSGFIRDPFEGLGLVYPLRFIMEVFEDIAALKGVVLTKGTSLQILNDVAQIPLDHFHKVRKAINRAHAAALSFATDDKVAYLRGEILAHLVPDMKGSSFRKPVDVLRQNINEALIKPGKRQKVTANAEAAVQIVRRSVSDLASDAPSELYRLNRAIEYVALTDLTTAFEKKLHAKLTENHWQKFLTSNPFILRLAFGFPIAIFGEQVSVGGGAFNGSGGKLADYVVRSGLLGNVSLVEIKKPGTALVDAKPYRGGVYAPSKELFGAVTQVLDQRFHLQGEISQKKINSRIYDIYAYSVQCVVIAGRIPETDDARRSLELYRSNLRDVVVVTFDELLSKLKAIAQFLADGQEEDNIAPRLLGDEKSDATYDEYQDDDIEGDLEEE